MIEGITEQELRQDMADARLRLDASDEAPEFIGRSGVLQARGAFSTYWRIRRINMRMLSV